MNKTEFETEKKNLDSQNAELNEKIDLYKKNFQKVLKVFLETFDLNNDVIRKNGNKAETGRLRIINDEYKSKRNIKAYVVFHPYKKDGELSNAHRTDDFDVNTPSEYFDALLKTYEPKNTF